MSTFSNLAAKVNKLFVPLLSAPVIGGLLGKGMIVVSYTGRKSGKHVELPVGYTRKGETVTIRVAMPDQKSWWRNFGGAGAPLTLHLPDGERTGHAVSHRSDSGAVTVTVDLA